VTFLHAPTLRTRQTAEAVRAGMARSRGDAELGSPLVEHAIRNPDLYVAGHRVEMVSSPEALATQMPADALGAAPVEEHPFFAPFWAAGDRIGYWLDAEDPPGERADECARWFFTFARSLRDADVRHTRAFVCVTHSGPLRAILGRYVLDHDPGEPEYAEAVHLELLTDGSITWRFRDAVNQM
jgi:broad specificity phosphatase PhoE